MKPPPSIRVENIPDEGLSLELSLDGQWLAGVLSDAAMQVTPGTHATARVRLDRDGTDVIVSGSFWASLTAECVACLEDVALPIEGEFQLVLSPESKKTNARGGDVELTSDELDTDFYSDDAVDLAHWLREQVLLAAPLHPRHEGDCPRPLVPVTAPINGGTERGIDPRLAPLLHLSRKE